MKNSHSLSNKKTDDNNTLQKAFLKMKRAVYKSTCSTWYERSIEGTLESFEPNIDINIQREFLEEDKSELINWLEMNKSKFPWIYFPKEIECANKNNHIFYIIKYENQIVGFSKVGVNGTYIHDFDKTLQLKEDTFLIYDIFIDPSMGGKGLAVFAVKDIFMHLKDKGYKRVIVHIEKWNKASIKTATKSGLKPKLDICFVKILGIPLYFKNGYIPFRNIEKIINS